MSAGAPVRGRVRAQVRNGVRTDVRDGVRTTISEIQRQGACLLTLSRSRLADFYTPQDGEP